MSRRLNLLVYGGPGAGKSWFANTSPGPKLLFDAEGRADYLADLTKDETGRTPQRIVYWNPRQDPPAESSEPDMLTVINVSEFDDLELGYKWLVSGKHPFKSVVIDSLTDVQQRLVDKVAGNGAVQLQHWNTVLRELEKKIRSFRDLRKHPTNPLWAFVCIVGDRTKDDSAGLLLQGQIADKAPYHFDTVGYLQKRRNGTTGAKERAMLIDGYTDGIEAKDNTHVLSLHYGEEIVNPNVSDMLRALNPTTD